MSQAKYILMFDMHSSSHNTFGTASSSEVSVLLILEELRLMRKDLNVGMSKLQEEIKALVNIIKPRDENDEFFSRKPITANQVSSSCSKSFVKLCENIVENKAVHVQESDHLQAITTVNNTETSRHLPAGGCTESDPLPKDNISVNSIICQKAYIKEESNANSSSAFLPNTMESQKNLSSALEQTASFSKKTEEHEKYHNTAFISTSTNNSKKSVCMNMRLNCNLCFKNFSSLYKLKKHRFEVHKLAHRYVCSFCGRSCSSSNYLKIHLRIHTGEKPYKCNICEKSFTDKSNYTRHRRNGKNRICGVCEKVLCSAFELKRHLQTHRMNMTIP